MLQKCLHEGIAGIQTGVQRECSVLNATNMTAVLPLEMNIRPFLNLSGVYVKISMLT